MLGFALSGPFRSVWTSFATFLDLRGGPARAARLSFVSNVMRTSGCCGLRRLRPDGRRKATRTTARVVALAAFVVLAVAALAAGSARAAIDGAGALAPPTITSDKAAYSPGELVTLSGSGWQAGESVHILVNDDAGQTWSHTADVTAAADGTISDQFNLPDWFVARYSVTATGAQSGTATTTFTDA